MTQGKKWENDITTNELLHGQMSRIFHHVLQKKKTDHDSGTDLQNLPLLAIWMSPANRAKNVILLTAEDEYKLRFD